MWRSTDYPTHQERIAIDPELRRPRVARGLVISALGGAVGVREGRSYDLDGRLIARERVSTNGTVGQLNLDSLFYDQRSNVDSARMYNASKFNAGESIGGLIRAAEDVLPTQARRGALQRIVDAGREIGIDRLTGKPTSFYTVITDKLGNLITAHPGIP